MVEREDLIAAKIRRCMLPLMQAWQSIPQRAVRTFEAATHMNISIHDLNGVLWSYLPRTYFGHQIPLCMQLKTTHCEDCARFDQHAVRRMSAERPEGFSKVCFAGIVEWVVPVFENNALLWVLFAGQRSAGAGFKAMLVDTKCAPAKRATALEPVTAAQSELILEQLCQLAARLKAWRRELPRGMPRTGKPIVDVACRRIAVLRYIDAQHTYPITLGDLAELLKLSLYRASHAIQQACGASFTDLLVQARLRTAAALLRHTRRSVLDVAHESGFSDVSNFHRLFKKQFNTTPLQYRATMENNP
jgi:AraC-like DNA-binding protein